MDEIRHVQVTDESLIKWKYNLEGYSKIAFGGENASALELYLNWLKAMGWIFESFTFSVNPPLNERMWNIIIKNENIHNHIKCPYPNSSFKPFDKSIQKDDDNSELDNEIVKLHEIIEIEFPISNFLANPSSWEELAKITFLVLKECIKKKNKSISRYKRKVNENKTSNRNGS